MSAGALVAAARRLHERTAALEFGPPVTHVYAPLDYAWAVHEQYLSRYGPALRGAIGPNERG